MKAVVWSKNYCPYCVAAKDLLSDMGVEIEERRVGDGYTREQFMESNPGKRTVPQIYIEGDHIGGYDDLLKYIETTGFNGTGNLL